MSYFLNKKNLHLVFNSISLIVRDGSNNPYTIMFDREHSIQIHKNIQGVLFNWTSFVALQSFSKT